MLAGAIQCKTTRYVYWQDEEMWLGFLQEYPDYRTQGETKDELKENLRDIYNDLASGSIAYVGELPDLKRREATDKEKSI